MNSNAVRHYQTTSEPASFQRRVLLAVSGLTPQIVTETLYALAADELAPFVPTEVHLITSAEGARRAELSLLSDDLGWFHKLCADYHLPGVKFDLTAGLAAAGFAEKIPALNLKGLRRLCRHQTHALP
jgi:hypothetical protein